jgi:hypothetical protein
MQKFEYRNPRYLVDLLVLFTVQNSIIPGRCTEISKEGMTVELREPVPVETCGTVSLSYKELTLLLPVSVAHSGTGNDGLKFRLESEEDRNLVDRLVALVAGPTGQPGPVLVR